MTPERLRTLLQTSGSDPRRWPAHEQAAARELLDHEAPGWNEARVDADRLDAWLDQHTVEAPDDGLVQRILATAPVAATRPAGRWRGLGQWLWPGAGLAGAGLAGTLAGALAVSVALRAGPAPSATDAGERVTAFSEPLTDWRDE
ncbi:MAG: hypothetical protein KF686_03720 [Ramlibacter sp.]|nr:hypothetical protein [Ramlibacter sp.]